MAGEGKRTRKRIGHTTFDKAQKWEGWIDYLAASEASAEALRDAETKKDAIRAHIKSDLQKRQKVSPDARIDFTYDRKTDRIHIFEVTGEAKRQRGPTSEDLFLEGAAGEEQQDTGEPGKVVRQTFGRDRSGIAKTPPSAKQGDSVRATIQSILDRNMKSEEG